MDKLYLDIEQLERYQNNRCSEGEKAEIEKRLAGDAEFRGLYDDMETMSETVSKTADKATSVEEKLAKLKDSLSQTEDEAPVIDLRPTPNRWPLAVAASVAVLVAAWFAIDFIAGSASPQELALSYYELPAAPASSMSQEEERWAAGLAAYQSNDYPGAVTQWQQLPDPTAEQRYYLAHGYLNNTQYNEAIVIFHALATGQSLYNYPSEWNLALAHLMNNNVESSVEVLGRIEVSVGHPYVSDARDLLSSLKKLSVP